MVLKPSEQTPATSQLLGELIPKYLDPDLYHLVNGGVPETTKVGPAGCMVRDALTNESQLLELKWDHSKCMMFSLLDPSADFLRQFSTLVRLSRAKYEGTLYSQRSDRQRACRPYHC